MHSSARRSPILEQLRIEAVSTPEEARRFLEIYFKGEDHWLRRNSRGRKLPGGRVDTIKHVVRLHTKYRQIFLEEARKSGMSEEEITELDISMSKSHNYKKFTLEY